MDLLRGRQNVRMLKFLRKSQYWSHQQMKAWQLDRLNILLQNAKKNSSFYAMKLEGFKIPLQHLEAIQELPILTRDDIKLFFNDICCRNINLKTCELSRTGGSTGEPMRYYLSKNSKNWNRGTVYRSAEWANVYLGDRLVQMTGSHYDYKKFQKIQQKLILFFQRYKDLSVASVTEDLFHKYYKIIKQYKPKSIWGYSSGIYQFAKFIETHYPSSEFGYLKALITSSETLRSDWREKINSVFGIEKVFDHYGSREAYIASECSQHKGYHIHSETIILEVIKKNGEWQQKGDMGKIVITDLSNHAFPFIRYAIGDVGIMGDRRMCPCGVSLPLLEKVVGRISDCIILKDRILTPFFGTLMSSSNGIEAYQIIQESMEKLIVKIIKNEKYTPGDENMIKKTLENLSGLEHGVCLEYVDKIPVPPSGKRRFVISNISSSYL